ncbi:MAG: Nramp family divalent metal transporter [Xanthomonadales bacterium]
MKRFLAIAGPGLLVAATGIGAGDLATASFAGSILGTAILWAAVLGAFMKFVITEGVARWQLATGTTLIEGVVLRIGRPAGWLFLAYLLFWSFFVASALMSACGVTLHALFPVIDDPGRAKTAFGIGASLIGAALVLRGGYRLFSRVMQVCIGAMFVTVLVTAGLLWPGAAPVAAGLLLPAIPAVDGGLTWTIALMGGIGGTVTVLGYGYWIREEGRQGPAALRVCRIDLAVAYAVTALFGIAMVIIGSTIEVHGRGAGLIVDLAEQLGSAVGPTGRLLFLLGAAGAVFSSLLGVWQAIPCLFADLWGMLSGPADPDADGKPAANLEQSRTARMFLLALATVPMTGLFFSFREVQKFYAVTGAWFVPLLTLALLVLNGRSAWVGAAWRNRPATSIAMLVILGFFSWIAFRTLVA